MNKILLVLMVMAVCGICGCASNDSDFQPDKLKYPYQASPERSSRISRGISKLFKGMPQEGVVKIMGEPDEKNYYYSTFESMGSKKPDGYIWVYIIRRSKPYGGFIQRKEKSVKLRFNLSRSLVKIDVLGFGVQRSYKR